MYVDATDDRGVRFLRHIECDGSICDGRVFDPKRRPDDADDWLKVVVQSGPIIAPETTISHYCPACALGRERR